MNTLLPALLHIMMAAATLATAPALGELASRMLSRPSRWIWALAMVLMVALPLITALPPTPPAGADVSRLAQVNDHIASSAQAGVALMVAGTRATDTPDLSLAAPGITAPALAATLWIAASLLVAMWLWRSHHQLLQRRRHWREGVVNGQPVLLAADAGPAVVGVWQPRIVLPAAMVDGPPAHLASVMAHEQAHINAGDTRLLAAMAVLLVVMPWQPFLWFAMMRLRLAIEVDCDARVLAAGHQLRDYGAALVDCAANKGFGAGVGAMSASGGFLEQRLRLMMHRPARWQRWLAPLLLMLAGDCCIMAVAVARTAPALVAQAPDPGRAALAGYYQVGYQRVAVVGVTAKGMSMKINMERQADLLPSSADDYFIPATDISVHFDRSAHTMRVRQRGVDGDAAPRVEGAAVEAADAWIASRVARQQPFPTGAAIIARNLAATRFEQLHTSDFTPEFLRLAEPLMPLQQKRAASYGALQEVTFEGVTRQGWDRYKARYANRTVNWAIWMDGQGRLAAAFADDTSVK